MLKYYTFLVNFYVDRVSRVAADVLATMAPGH